MESKKSGESYFQMPLHYPRYTKKEYQNMPEWQLDRLLAEYGLLATANTDLAAKREFAIGAFLWPDYHQDSSPHNSWTRQKKSKVVRLLCRALGFA